MNKRNVRFSLLEIENPEIWEEIEQAEQQGCKAGDTVKRLLQELVYKRELVNVLQGSISPDEPSSNDIVQSLNDEDLLDDIFRVK